ncbi:MAG: hypothetical protein ABSH51_31960, partial [Solirubrobacteraceae bacterium]
MEAHAFEARGNPIVASGEALCHPCPSLRKVVFCATPARPIHHLSRHGARMPATGPVDELDAPTATERQRTVADPFDAPVELATAMSEPSQASGSPTPSPDTVREVIRELAKLLAAL